MKIFFLGDSTVESHLLTGDYLRQRAEMASAAIPTKIDCSVDELLASDDFDWGGVLCGTDEDGRNYCGKTYRVSEPAASMATRTTTTILTAASLAANRTAAATAGAAAATYAATHDPFRRRDVEYQQLEQEIAQRHRHDQRL